ncbi:mitochondrial nucleoid-associated protein 1 [Clinocottus analis]|uniref:mitochondrial nucleoid-associated protein 1 n=1 Tax=Clinocottus analis TaxID=304258 RepID=UPI0035BED64F
MSSEECPFCGKTYKRLKSHLPHCKAAATSSKTPPTKQEVTVTQASPSTQLVAALCEPAAKSTQTLSATLSPQSKKSKKTSVVSSAATQSSLSSSLVSASLPPSTKERKPKLSEQIKTASITNFPTSAPSLPPSPAIPKPKKQSIRSLIEAAKSEQVSKGPLAATGSASNGPPSGSAPFVADPQRSRATTETGTKTDRESLKDEALSAFLAPDIKRKDASRKKASRTKKAAQSLPTTEDASRSLDSHLWAEDDDGKVEDLSVSKMFLTPESGRQATITLQDAKATLGRANATRQSGRPSILSQIETADALSSKISPVPLPTGGLIPTETVSDQLPCTSSQHAELQSVTGKSLMSKQASLIPQHQLELTSPAAPLLSGQLSSQVSKATPPLRPVGTNERLKVTGLLTISPSRTALFSPLPAARGETLRAGGGWKSQPEARQLNTADKGTTGALTQRRLGQVRLRELPEWLACKTPSHPREVVEMVQRGWQWYYKKYIDVKKGGAGGLSMMLAGYCVLSYIWNYPHIKRDRWRKHH